MNPSGALKLYRNARICPAGDPADTQRPVARFHLQAAADTHLYFLAEYTWTRLILSRMKQDPQWPRWIKKN